MTKRVLPTCVQYHISRMVTRSSHDVPHATSIQFRWSSEIHNVFVAVLRSDTCRVSAGNA